MLAGMCSRCWSDTREVYLPDETVPVPPAGVSCSATHHGRAVVTVVGGLPAGPGTRVRLAMSWSKSGERDG